VQSYLLYTFTFKNESNVGAYLPSQFISKIISTNLANDAVFTFISDFLTKQDIEICWMIRIFINVNDEYSARARARLRHGNNCA